MQMCITTAHHQTSILVRRTMLPLSTIDSSIFSRSMIFDVGPRPAPHFPSRCAPDSRSHVLEENASSRRAVTG
jgi:hypothetical protein